MSTGVYKRSKEQIYKLRELAKEPRSLRGGGYQAIHKWLVEHYSKANKCENLDCTGQSKRFHWCLIRGTEYEHKRENFMMLCTSCHRRYDDNEEWRKNNGNARRGKTLTKKRKQNISEAMKGQNIGDQRGTKKVIQFDLNGEPIKIWDSAVEVAQFLKISASGISMCCHGRLNQSGGFKWIFLNK